MLADVRKAMPAYLVARKIRAAKFVLGCIPYSLKASVPHGFSASATHSHPKQPPPADYQPKKG